MPDERRAGWAIRVRATSDPDDRPVFIGVARSADVDTYLSGIAHAEVVDVTLVQTP